VVLLRVLYAVRLISSLLLIDCCGSILLRRFATLRLCRFAALRLRSFAALSQLCSFAASQLFCRSSVARPLPRNFSHAHTHSLTPTATAVLSLERHFVVFSNVIRSLTQCIIAALQMNYWEREVLIISFSATRVSDVGCALCWALVECPFSIFHF